MSLPRVLYVAATNDIYELPLYVCDSSAELSRWLGKRSNVLPTIIHSSTGIVQTKSKRFKYFRMDSRTGKIIVGARPSGRPKKRKETKPKEKAT